jgi:hypothetical protein
MMAKFQAGVLRGSSKTTSDSRNQTRLSITFFLEDRAIISNFFLEDHNAISKKVFGRFNDDFQNFSGTSYEAIPTFSKTGTHVSGVRTRKPNSDV